MSPAQKWGATNNITQQTNPAGSEFCFWIRVPMVQKDASYGRYMPGVPHWNINTHHSSPRPDFALGRGPNTKL